MKQVMMTEIPESGTDENGDNDDKEGTKFLCGKVLLSIDASNLLNFHRTKSTFCISRGQKYSSLCWFKNLTRGCNIEEEMSSLSSVPSCH